MSEANEQLHQKIRELIPINELSPNLQGKLLEKAKIMEVKKSRFIFKQGDKDDYSYYLLDGEIELHANEQLESVIQSGSDRAKYALAQLQPRQFSAKAKTPLKILLIERNNLDQLMMLAQETTADPTRRSGTGADMEVDEVGGVDDDTDWMTQMLQSELFSKIPMANIHQLFALLEEVEFSAGDVVIKQGDPGDHYYIVSEGRCAVSRKPTPKSNDIKLAELKTGDSFGEEALISESTRNATITMITDGILMKLTKETFVELVKKPTLQSLTFDEADALVNEGSAKWLDVRFPNEHGESSIEDSLNIPLNSLRLKSDELDSSMIYILYCDTSGRSSTGAFLLAERGFDVSYLDGGLVNNPEAVGVQTVVPKAPEPEKPSAATPAQQSNDKDDAEKKKEHEASQKKLEEEKLKLEKEKKLAQAEATKKAEQEEARLIKLQAESDMQMQQEKKKLEEIYNKNARDMEEIQKAKEAAQETLRKEREKLEEQAEVARKQIEEATRIKQEAEASRKKLEELEASKKLLEEAAEKKRLEDEEHEKQLQAEAKASIEAERKKLAAQYERNSKEFEELQKGKAAAEAAKLAAKEEAEKIIEEYKSSHDKTRAEEEAKLKAERQKLEEESRKIQEAMKEIQAAKLEAEQAKQQALAEAGRLKEKQMESTSSREQREKLELEIKAVQQKAFEAEREIEDAAHREKLTESAKQVNEADLTKKKQQEEAFLAQVEGDLQNFEETQEEEAESITQVQMHSDMMKRIKLKAADAKKKAAQANSSLLDDISNQLGDKK
ncbi:MAG: CRP-like cAMP-binding protein [Gammaproteobacteria bacterium]|jgi:CRP-like cAMP-binding protein